MIMDPNFIVKVLLSLIVAAALAFAVTPLVKRLAQRVGAMDVPKDERRMHKIPIPRMGGLAIFFAFLIAVLCFAGIDRELRGILLGAGGLTRAYAKAAKDALDAAGKARMQPFSVLLLECPYPMFERIKLLIEGHEGRIESSDYGAAVTLTFLLPVQKVADFSAALTELSGGQMSAEEVEQRFLPGARE